MATVTFHGNLKRFSRQPIELEVSSFGELISGLITQIQGLREELRHGCYKIRLGKRYLNEGEIKQNALNLSEQCHIHITPVINGAGKAMSAAFMVVGVALLAVALAPTTLALSTQMMMATMGVSFAISGAMGMLMKPPKMPETKLSDSEKKNSTSFSNLRNLTPQGKPIPLLYGKMMTSLVLISQGVNTFDEIAQKNADKPKDNARASDNKLVRAMGLG